MDMILPTLYSEVQNSTLGYPITSFPIFPVRSPMICAFLFSSPFQEVETMLRCLL